ncbi:MAG: 4-hydroxy-tetrahydrodipicolinate synthase [Thermoplasmata archaeon]|nr:4-hydroxy-tetrahydrodipicolinate synthase [Thermoplasmata archaeon]
MLKGCYTALITPMHSDGALDFEGLEDLLAFQAKNGIDGVVAVGTTGESPTLDWDEHMIVIEKTACFANDNLLVIAGTGANSTHESVIATRKAVDAEVNTMLLVDPYYNGPSSLEIRKEYYEPLAKEFPDTKFIPYIIPGRTGTMLLPEDLAILSHNSQNVIAVKEATGDLENMRAIRRLCRPDFAIISGDDEKTLSMIEDSTILASGVISVISNVFPGAMREMVNAMLDNDRSRARRLEATMKPMIDCVTVKTEEKTAFGKVVCKARNPLAIKTLMNILGMPAGPCRKPLGKMTRAGIAKVVESARAIYSADRKIFDPIEEHFEIDVNERLSDSRYLEGLYYESY